MSHVTPFPHQVTGAAFLAAGDPSALLADEPRVGKTGAAIMAADRINAITILVVTTASGRPVWEKAFRDWSPKRTAAIYIGGVVPKAEVLIVAWSLLQAPAKLGNLIGLRWHLIIADESHAAKNFNAKRTQSLYGRMSGSHGLDQMRALCIRADRLWSLTGTPLPHSPFDAYPMLRALAPEKLLANRERGWPDVTNEGDFMHRYCIVRMKQIGAWNKIPVVVGGGNEPQRSAR